MLPEDQSAALNTSGAENPSHDMDMVPLFSETGAMAEMESLAIQGILHASNIPFTVFGNATLPVTEFSVQVPASRLSEAQRVLADAREAGPAAAEAAELESERLGTVPE